MRVRECLCPPSLVVEWLSRELEDRGIPGTVYAHTLLSLLHYHFCHHSATTTNGDVPGAADHAHSSPMNLATTPPSSSFLSSLDLQQHKLRHLTHGKCSCLLQGTAKDSASGIISSANCHTTSSSGAAATGSSRGTPASRRSNSAGVLIANNTTIKRNRRNSGGYKASSCSDGLGISVTSGRLLEEEEELVLGHGLHPDADLPLVPHPKTTPKKVPNQVSLESNSRERRLL